MFDVGFWELALIGVVMLVILGPERLPGVARTAGLWIGKARRMMADVKKDINRELREHEMQELSKIKDDIQKTGEEFAQASEGLSDSISDNDFTKSLQQPVGSLTGDENPIDTKSEDKTRNTSSEKTAPKSPRKSPQTKSSKPKKEKSKKEKSKNKASKEKGSKETAGNKAASDDKAKINQS